LLEVNIRDARLLLELAEHSGVEGLRLFDKPTGKSPLVLERRNPAPYEKNVQHPLTEGKDDDVDSNADRASAHTPTMVKNRILGGPTVIAPHLSRSPLSSRHLKYFS